MNIKSLRIKANLTQTDVANELGVSHASVAHWESGKAMPTADKLPKLAQLFGCTINDLFLKKDVM